MAKTKIGWAPRNPQLVEVTLRCAEWMAMMMIIAYSKRQFPLSVEQKLLVHFAFQSGTLADNSENLIYLVSFVETRESSLSRR